MSALMLPVLFGFVALAIDVGYTFDYRRRMQTAADSGAIAGALAVEANSAITDAALAIIVRADVEQNGFQHAANSIAVAVCRPPAGGCTTTYTYVAANRAVKVEITQPKSTFFSQVLGLSSFDVGTKAVASKGGDSGASFIILNDNCENSMTVSGGSQIATAGSVQVNSCDADALKVGGGGYLNAAGGVFVTGDGSGGGIDLSGGSTMSPAGTVGAPPIADPLASRAEPDCSGLTDYGDADPAGGALPSGNYENITIDGDAVVTLSGLYCVDGGKFKVSSAQVTGTNVTIYTYNDASLVIANNDTVVTLSAPTSGANEGILYWQARDNVRDAVISGGATVNLTGIIYQVNPSSKFSYTGGSSSGSLANYTILIVWELVIGGGGFVGSNDYSSLTSGAPLQRLCLAE